jgi:alpha-1,6-mannosyltransferase
VIKRTGLSLNLWVIAAALTVLTLISAVIPREDYATISAFAIAEAPFYAAALWFVIFRPTTAITDPDRALVSILIVGVVLRVILIAAPPVSTDIFRYVWDGRVQAAGINPYRYIPADPALQSLRDTVIYPGINRADYAPTIYPPVSQMFYFAVTRVSETITFMKVAVVAVEGVGVWALLQLLRARELSSSRVLAYVWHPLPVFSFAGDGHIDVVAMTFLLLAFVAVDRRSPVWAGVALALGVVAKYFPVVAGPAIYKRWDWKMPAAFVVTAAALYLPYVGVGTKVFGFLGGYVAEEGFDQGSGVYLWSLINEVVRLPGWTAVFYFAAAAVAMAIIALARTLRWKDYRADIATAMILAVMFLVVFSPHYPWYFGWIVPFLCFYPVIGVIYLTSAVSYVNIAEWPPDVAVNSCIYLPMFAILAGEFWVRRQIRKEEPRGSALVA